MKKSFLLSALALLAIAAMGFSSDSAKRTKAPAASSCCSEGAACCTPGADCCK